MPGESHGWNSLVGCRPCGRKESTEQLTRSTMQYDYWASHMVLVVKNPLAITGDAKYAGSIPGSGRSPGEGNGNLLQYSCLKNPMDRGAWWATVHGAAKS